MGLKKKAILKKSFDICLNVFIAIFCIILMISIYNMIQTKILKKNYADFFGYSLFEVQTGSMADTINPGDWIIVKKQKKFNLNDIITYKMSGEFITHRIIESYNGTFVTKGDANNTKDDPVDEKQIVGKVVKILHHFGILKKTIFNPIVIIILIFNIFIICSIFDNDENNFATILIKKGIIYLKDKLKQIKFLNGFIEKLENEIKKIKQQDTVATNVETVNQVRNVQIDEKKLNEMKKMSDIGADFNMNNSNKEDKDYIFRFPVGNNNESTEKSYREKRKTSYDQLNGNTNFFPIKDLTLFDDNNDQNLNYISIDETMSTAEKKYDDIKDITLDKNNSNSQNLNYISIEPNLDNSTKQVSQKQELIFDEDYSKSNVESKTRQTTNNSNKENINYNILEKAPVEITNQKSKGMDQFISISPKEIDNTLFEISKNKPKVETSEEQPKAEIVEEQKPEREQMPTKIKLDLFELPKNKKSKNIIEKIIKVKIEEINEIINVLIENRKFKTNEVSIKNTLMAAYIESRYYNYYGYMDVKQYEIKNPSKIEKYLNLVGRTLISRYDGNDSKYEEKVNEFLNLYFLINRLESSVKISDFNNKKKYYEEEIERCLKISNLDNVNVNDMASSILSVQRNYVSIISYIYKKIKSPLFHIIFKRITGLEYSYGVQLEHSVTFNKAYSDYIIDKVYNEGVIAQDKIIVLLTILSAQISSDMICRNFGRKYFVEVPEILVAKTNKLSKALRLVDNEYSKECTIFVTSMKSLIGHKAIISEKVKEGYKWAVYIENGRKIDRKHINMLLSMEYVFVNRLDANMKNLLSSMGEDIIKKVKNIDILSIVGSSGDK